MDHSDILPERMIRRQLQQACRMPTERERSPFAQRLVASRRAAGLSQKQVAARLGLRQSTISDIESAEEFSSYTAALAKLYGVDHHWLATGEGSPDAVLIDGQHRLHVVLKSMNRARKVPANVHADQLSQMTVAIEELADDALMQLPDDERALILAYRALLPEDRGPATAELLRLGAMAQRYRRAADSEFMQGSFSGRAQLAPQARGAMSTRSAATDAAPDAPADPFAGVDSRKKQK